jgi:hypothetical protein
MNSLRTKKERPAPSDLFGGPLSAASAQLGDEELVLDERAARCPAQMVEDKLLSMLKGGGAMVSQQRLKQLIGRRR